MMHPRSARTLLMCAIGVVLAGTWSAVTSSPAGATVPGDASAIVVSAGTLSNVTITSSPTGVTMQPSTFSTATQDYALRTCAGKALTVALSGSGMQVGAQSGSSINVHVNLASGEALIVSTPTMQYWFRCLPNDFPPVTVVNHGTTGPGWYVTASISPRATGNPGLYPMILDSNGTPVWYTPVGPAIDFQQLQGSTLSWATPESGLAGLFHLYQYDTQTNVTLQPAPTTHWSSPRPPADIHELLRLSNGNYMMLALPTTTDNSATFTDATGTPHLNVNIVDCVIEELTPSGGLVWSWDAYYDQHISPSETFLGTSALNGAYDVYHCNSIDIDPTVSNPSQADVLMSARNLDAIYRIQRSGGTVLWKLGNDHATGTALTAAQTTGNDHEPLLTSTWLTGESTIGGQHDARFQSGGGMSFYDDHTGQPTTVHGARGVEANIVNNGSTHTATETAEFLAPDDSTAANATGSFRPNSAANAGAGDNVVGWGVRNTLSMTEFDNAGNDLRDIYLSPSPGATSGNFSTYRFVKLPLGALSATVLRQTAGYPRSALASVPRGWNHPRDLIVQTQYGNGGTIAGDGVSLADAGGDMIAAFWKGADGNLWNAWTLNGGANFSTPKPLSSKPLGGDPHAVVSNAGRTDVFWKGTDGTLRHDTHVVNGPWSGSQSLGGAGTMGGDPFPVAFGASGIDVFWKGVDGNLWYAATTDGSTWLLPQSLGGGPLGSDPHPVSAGTSLQVFWTGTDGNLWNATYTTGTGWQAAQSLGGAPLASDPQPVSSASGVINVFWQGADNGLHDDGFSDGSGWTGPQLIGGVGQVTAPPSPVSPAANDIDVFWRTTNALSGSRSLSEATYVSGSGWTFVPAPSHTSLTLDPSAAQTKPGQVAVFAQSLDGAFWFQTTSGS